MTAPAGSAPLIGRGRELAVLRGALDAVRAGAGGCVLLVGDPGIGKTRLLRELGREARAAGAVVLAGRGVQGGGPFRPLVEALLRAAPADHSEQPRLAPYAPVLARLLPTWGAPAGQLAAPLADPVVVLGEAVLELLRVLAGGNGALVLLDDMHWADRDTLVLLEYLVDGLADTGVLVVAGCRDEPGAGEALTALRSHAETRTVEVRRLEGGDVDALARSCGGAAVAPEVRRFLAETADGLPFLVEELFAGLVESGSVRRTADGWEPAGPLTVRVPSTLRALVDRRMATLSAGARGVVHTVAVLGAAVDWRLLPAVTGLADDVIAAGLREAVDASLLILDSGADGALRWRHALTRDAVLAGMLAPEQAAIAVRAADALAHASAPLTGDRLALATDLYARAGHGAAAARLLLSLAREAVDAGALRSAEEALVRAAGSASGALRDEITVEQARVLALAGRTEDAVAAGEPLLGRLVGRDRLLLGVQLARAAVAAERFDEAAGYLARAEAPADPRVLAVSAHVALGRGDRGEAAGIAAAAVAAGRATDLPEVVCEALEIVGRCLRRSDPPASEAAFADAEALAAARGLTPWRIRALAELGTHDQLRRGTTHRLEEARSRALEAGMLVTAATLDLQIGAAVSGQTGHVESLPWVRRSAEQAGRLRLPNLRAMALLFVAAGELLADRPEEAAACRTEAVSIAPDAVDLRGFVHMLDGLRAWTDGDDAAAVASFDAGVRELRGNLVASPSPAWGMWTVLRTAADPADGRAREELRASDVVVHLSNRAALRYADALAAASEGRRAAAAALLAAGDEASVCHPFLHHQLRCMAATAAAAHGLGDPGAWLREAMAYFEAHGATRLGRQCRARMRRLGVPVPRPGPGVGAVPERLRALGVTRRESEVLELVARGLSNPEIAARLFLSPRTVETHVSNLLAKTGTGSRGGLAALPR